MVDTKEPITLLDDLMKGGFIGNVYIHPDINGNYAYSVRIILPEGMYGGPDTPTVAHINKYDPKTGINYGAPACQGDKMNLTMCLNDKRADKGIVKLINKNYPNGV